MLGTPCQPDFRGAILVFEDYFKSMSIPVFSGSQFGHIRKKFTLPIGLEAEMDADAGTITMLQAAVVG